MKIVLTSENNAKREALERVLLKTRIYAEIICINVDSGVSNTPHSDDEGIAGCRNRIAEGKKKVLDANMYVAMEGIVAKNVYGTFLCGWCGIEDTGTGRLAFGCSAKVQIPNFIARNISTFGELSELVKENYNSQLINYIDAIGSNGVITNELYTRPDEFADAMRCALGYLMNDKNYLSNQ